MQERETYGWVGDRTIPGPGCQTPLCCTAGREQMLRDIAGIIPQVRALALWPDRWNDKLCKRCEVTARKRHGTGRNVVWDNLPHIFDFTKWPNLRLAEKREVSSNSIVCNTRSLHCLLSTAGPGNASSALLPFQNCHRCKSLLHPYHVLVIDSSG